MNRGTNSPERSPAIARVFLLALSPILVFGLLPSAALATESWRKDAPCGSPLASPKPAEKEGCWSSYCGEAPAFGRVCACQKSESSDEVELTLARGDRVLERFSAELWHEPLGAESLRLDEVDFDGDGRKELLIGLLTSRGQGMAVAEWSLWRFDGDALSHPVTVHDYGIVGFPTCAQGGKGALLLVTRWMDGWEPRRGDGLYLVGRWFEATSDAFQPAERPMVYRRFLSGLDNERARALTGDLPQPIRWYATPETRPVVGPYPALE